MVLRHSWLWLVCGGLLACAGPVPEAPKVAGQHAGALTEQTPVLVMDIAPGTEDASPAFAAEKDGVVFFYARDGVHGQGLWRTDGTEAGTFLLKGFNVGLSRDISGAGAVVNGVLYFQGVDPVADLGLW